MTADRKSDFKSTAGPVIRADEGAGTPVDSGFDVTGTELDSERLRTLSEEISRKFPFQLEHTALVLYDRDPGHLQAQWYVTPDDLAQARGAFPGDEGRPRQILRLCRLDQDGRAELVASALQEHGKPKGQEGFALHGDGAEYECELGLESDGGGWLLLARSNRVLVANRNFPPSTIGREIPAIQTRDSKRKGREELSDPPHVPVEAALAAIGEPLYPVFPNLELPQSPVAGRFSSEKRAPGHECPRVPEPEVPPDAVQQPTPDWESAADARLQADLAAMPPPLLPSMPDLREPGADMPGLLYDPRAALSSRALRGASPHASDMEEVHAELVVHGRAAPGSTIDLLGSPVQVGADGRFYVRRPLEDPLLLAFAIGQRQAPEQVAPESE